MDELKKNIYKLIVRRFIAIFYPAAEFNKVSVSIKVDNELFNASGKVCTKIGYLEVAKGIDDLKENKDIEILNNLKKGEKIEVKNYEIKDAETSPPTRYNSGSIILNSFQF